jgi:hypothetical protein
MTKRQICVNLEKSLIEEIDQNRGEVPRSRVVERALIEKYGNLDFCKSQEKEVGVGQ